MSSLLSTKNNNARTDMKKIFLTFGFAVMGMMTCAFGQQDNTTSDVKVRAQQALDAFLKPDTIDYIADKMHNWYLGLSVGGSYSMGENTRFVNFFDMTRPSFQLQVGRNFYPQFGLRVTASYLAQRGRAEWSTSEYLEKYAEQDGNYDFSIASGFLDGVVDFHSMLFGYKENRFFTLKGYLGLGAIYTFAFDQDKADWLQHPTYAEGNGHVGGSLLPKGYAYKVDTDNHWYFAGHVGLIGDFRINDAWSVNVDASFNGTDDAYNGVRYRRVYDSYVNLMAGATYRFKDGDGQRRLVYSHYIDKDVVDELNNMLQNTRDSLELAKQPIVNSYENVAYNEMLQTTVSFYIDKTFVTDAQKRNIRSVAKFMQTHPDVDVIITGYADVQTAYPKYNMMLSKKRAQNVYDILTQEYGADKNRLSMDYKGDEEQPFELVNEWNRAVVFYIKPHEAGFKAGVQDKADNIKLNSHESRRLNQTDSEQTRRP